METNPKYGKLLRGTLIAAATGGALYLAEQIPNMDLGSYGPIIVAVVGAAINALKVLAAKV